MAVMGFVTEFQPKGSNDCRGEGLGSGFDCDLDAEGHSTNHTCIKRRLVAVEGKIALVLEGLVLLQSPEATAAAAAAGGHQVRMLAVQT